MTREELVSELRKPFAHQWIGTHPAAADMLEADDSEIARLVALHERVAAVNDVAAAYQQVYFEDFPTVKAAQSDALIAREECNALRALIRELVAWPRALDAVGADLATRVQEAAL